MDITVNKDAKFSGCRAYRYALWRTWDISKPYALFIGLNPSTADEVEDDPTLRRCIDFSKSWGYGGVYMANLFAYCATQPEVMKKAVAPIGPENDAWITQLASTAGVVIAAWGNEGNFAGRSVQVRKMLPKMRCLKMNKTGEPAHPLYQPKSAMPISMSMPTRGRD